ncbi:MAG: metallophosphoesterase family protein [Atopobiaceae bacterium]
MENGAMRYDIISDTHGHLSKPLLDALEGADMIIHAGDCCSLQDYLCLQQIARVVMCLGNNDAYVDYSPAVKRMVRIFSSNLRWEVCHYQERLDLATCDVAICGHTHRPFVRREPNGVLLMNPGSPTYPRTSMGPTMGRIIAADDGTIQSAQILQLADEDEDRPGFARFFSRR